MSKKGINFAITYTAHATDEAITEIVTKAFETADWYKKIGAKKQVGKTLFENIANGNEIAVYLAKKYDGKFKYVLNRDSFKRGIRMFVNAYCEDSAEKTFFDGNRVYLNAGAIDADEADKVLQLALFGEVVYC